MSARIDNEKLLQLIKEMTFLYDIQDKRYGDNARKESAWREIGKQLGFPGRQCKKHWNSLRDAYRRALKKQRDIRNGLEQGPLKKWRFEDEMAFVLPYMRERTNASTNYNEDEDSNTDFDNIKIENTVLETPSYLPPVSSTSTFPTQVPEESGNATSASFKRRRLVRETPSTVLLKHLLKKKEEDDIDIFFSGMAATVKQFPPRQRAIAKAQVFSVISKLEIESLSQHTPEEPLLYVSANYANESSSHVYGHSRPSSESETESKFQAHMDEHC